MMSDKQLDSVILGYRKIRYVTDRCVEGEGRGRGGREGFVEQRTLWNNVLV